MNIYSLHEKRYEHAKERVQEELTDYFVDLDRQQKLWYFVVALKGHAQRYDFTTNQADHLAARLSNYFAIIQANVDAARAFSSSRSNVEKDKNKTIPLNHSCLSEEAFSEHLATLDSLLYEGTLEYRQAMELLLVLLEHYSHCQRKIPN